MPDLSLLVPLSKELGISLNELLAGEEIEKEKVIEYSEQNLLSTIDYTEKKIKDVHKKISAFIMGMGILICICSFTIFPSESSWGEVYSFIGLLLTVAGIFRELRFSSNWKKGLVSAGILILLLGVFFAADYIGVTQFKRPPIYKYKTTTVFDDTDNKLIEYRNLFYNVYRINADTPNEYYLIDSNRRQQQYGASDRALPLSEYGFVFEIDSQNCGVTIDYHFTDWYGNENLYTERALVYNSVSIFALIENLKYITFNFSGAAILSPVMRLKIIIRITTIFLQIIRLISGISGSMWSRK